MQRKNGAYGVDFGANAAANGVRADYARKMEDEDLEAGSMTQDLTSSIYNFEDLIKGNFLYVDKTEYIWNLIRPAKGFYFLSRPRRFGKSLLVSTLKAIFEGKKDGIPRGRRVFCWN